MKFSRLQHSIYAASIISVLLLCIAILVYEITQSNLQDFDVFYHAARAALEGKSIYSTTGIYNLPFWYLPWAAWFYIPFVFASREFALILFTALSILSAIVVVNSLTQYYNPSFKFLDKLLIFSLIIPMSLQLVLVGQMDYILLGLIVIAMYAIDQKKDVFAGLLFPLLWIKPHLLIVFTLFAFWRAGKRTALISLGLSACMLLAETIITPGWPLEMLSLLQEGTQRVNHKWNFTTLPNLLGSQENWVGTANLPFTILLVILAILVVWHFRSLPTLPLLSLALVASLFCAPRAYAYDLPLLIPAMIWLTAKNFKSTFWLWIAGTIIPIAAQLSSGAYVLILLVFVLSIWKAYHALRTAYTLQERTTSAD